MDRNQAIGLILISAMFLIYMMYFGGPTEKPSEKQKETTAQKQQPSQANNDNSSQVPKQTKSPDVQKQAETVDSSRQQQMLKQQYGSFAAGAQGKSRNIVIENKDVRIVIDSRGGQVESVLLKHYKTNKGAPLYLLDSTSSTQSMQVLTAGGKNINLAELYYKPSRMDIQVSPGDTQEVRLRMALSEHQYIEQIYRLGGEGYQLKYSLNLNGMGSLLQGKPMKWHWRNQVQKVERDMEESRNATTVYYYTCEEEFDYLSARSSETEQVEPEQSVKWVSLKQRFFNTGLIGDKCFSKAKFKSEVNTEDTSVVKILSAELNVPLQNISGQPGKFTFFLGPNKYNVVNKVTAGYKENVDLGWAVFAWINRFLVIPIFNFLDKYIASYGIIILILVFIVKTLLFPLAYKSYLSMAKMRELKPELDEIKERVGNDMQKVQAEQMQLYQKVGINPLSGCIPVLLQLPILLALFNFFPNSIELRQEAFLWAEDLSTYDAPIHLPFTIPFFGSHVSIFTLLMTLSTLAYTYYNNQINTSAQGPMKSIGYIMPVVFMFVLNRFPAGLTYYYFVSNIITISQQLVATKFIDREKIRQTMEENKAKAKHKKKSGFQARLQEAMKAQEEAKKNKKGKK